MAREDGGTRLDPIETAARRLLRHELLIERAARIATAAAWIAGFDELANTACDRNAVRIAAWYQDAWCMEDATNAAEIGARVLTRTPMELERRRAADVLVRQLRGTISSGVIEVAARAITESGFRETRMPEAWVLGEATCLESFGPMWLCAEIAKCTAEMKPIASLVAVWERQIEYGYWSRRINDAFRFVRSRRLAESRCAMLESFFVALRQQLDGSDRHGALSG